MTYLYPNNLTSKATLWLWQLRDLGIIGIGLLLSVLALSQTGTFLPLVAVAVYAFLSIRLDGFSVLDFLTCAATFFFLQQQYYEWRQEDGET